MLCIIKQCRAIEACNKIKVSGHMWKKIISSFFFLNTLLERGCAILCRIHWW